MAAGTPVIAGDCSAIREIIGTSGLLVTPGDAREMALAIELLMQDASLREKKVDVGLQQASRFPWRRSALEIVSLYRRAIEREPHDAMAGRPAEAKSPRI